MNNSLAVSLRNIDKVSLAMLQAVQSLAKSQMASSQLESRQTLLRPEESTLTSTLVAKTDNRTVLESANPSAMNRSSPSINIRKRLKSAKTRFVPWH
jgi:hypothetical protein